MFLKKFFLRCDTMPHQDFDDSGRLDILEYAYPAIDLRNTAMSHFIEQLRLAEKAAEDIYFARRDQELIESLHRRLLLEKAPGHVVVPPGTATRKETVRPS